MRIPLPISSYSDIPSSTARLINCYIEEGGGDKGVVLRSVPGVSVARPLGTGPIRALGLMRGHRFAVSGGKLYRDDQSVGSVFGTGRPQLAGNGTQLCVLVEPRLWIYDESDGSFAEVTDADFPGASSVQFFDSYITITEPDSGRWWASDFAAAESWNALSFATAEGYPDDLVTHVVDHRQALLLGKETCELWDNVNAGDFPFLRSPNGFIEMGCIAKHSAVKADQSVFWLANDKTVRRLSGMTPVRVSNHAVERFIRDATAEQAYAFSMTAEGHVCYVITFPEGTWVYDITTQQWHERKSYGERNWKASCAVEIGGQTYLGGDDNRLGVLDDVFTEWGEVQRMQWTYQPVYSERSGAVHSRLEILAESGVGVSSGQGSDPRIDLEYSDDGGKTFKYLSSRSLGAIGEYHQRAIWNRLGQSIDRVYRASISDPVRRKIIGTNLDLAGISG